MPTNPIPRGSKNLSVNVPEALHAELRRLASESNMSLSAYARHVLELACKQGLTMSTRYKAKDGQAPLMAAEDAP